MQRCGEAASYAVAVALLIGLGIALRTPVLNWIVGPVLVVAVVVTHGALTDRWRRGR